MLIDDTPKCLKIAGWRIGLFVFVDTRSEHRDHEYGAQHQGDGVQTVQRLHEAKWAEPMDDIQFMG